MAIQCGNTDCTKKIRKGMGRRAMVFGDKGMKLALVCPSCFQTMVSVVPPKPSTVAPRCATPGCRELAAFCAHCHERAGKHVRELSTANVVRHMAGQHEAGEEVE